MKKLIFAFAAMLVVAVSCTKDITPTVSFDKQVYVLLSDGSVDVKVNLSAPLPNDLIVPVTFAGDAVKGEDYVTDMDSFMIPYGETSAVITITALNNLAESSIKLSLGATTGCTFGKYSEATVTVDAKEKIIYSFAATTATVLDSYTVKLNLTGVESGSNFVASADMEIPVTITGDKGTYVTASESIIVKKGEKFGTLKVSPGEIEMGETATVTIAVDKEDAGSRFVEGTNKTIVLSITGKLNLASICGTWTFDSIFDLEELEFFISDDDADDPDLFPFNNEGFSFTIAEKKDEAGEVVGYTIKPNTTGDFAWYFRESDITYTAPMNYVEDQYTQLLGEYCAMEGYMFVSEITEDFLYNTYFKLSNVNRAFSADKESLGEGVIAFSLDAEGDLTLTIHDYDTPPFGQDCWWDDDDFDPDMFGFASLFKRAE